jgi:hypothetical protein
LVRVGLQKMAQAALVVFDYSEGTSMPLISEANLKYQSTDGFVFLDHSWLTRLYYTPRSPGPQNFWLH